MVRLDLAELLEVYWLREHIEPGAVAESVPLFSDAEREAIGELPAEMERCWQQGDAMRWFELDRRFHLTLLARTPMPEVRALSERLWNQAAPYMRAYVGSAPDRAAELTHLEHRLIAEAVVNGRPADAQQFLEVHIRRTRLALSLQPELLRTPPAAPGTGWATTGCAPSSKRQARTSAARAATASIRRPDPMMARRREWIVPHNPARRG